MENTNRSIKTILETGSISRAAKKLAITQPALSLWLARLEERNGFPIFNRESAALTLTEEGKAYLEHTERQIAEEKRFRRRIEDIRGGVTGTVTLGGSSCFNCLYIPPAVRIFVSRYPGASVRIINGTVGEIAERTLGGEIDIFLSPQSNVRKGIVSEELFSEYVVLCIPSEWEINAELAEYRIPEELILNGELNGESRAAVPFERLSGLPFIRLGKDIHIGGIADELFKRRGMEETTFIIADQMSTSLAMTSAGLGMSLITETVIRYGNRKTLPAFYMIDSDLGLRHMYMSTARDNYVSKACAAMTEVFRETLKNERCETK